MFEFFDGSGLVVADGRPAFKGNKPRAGAGGRENAFRMNVAK
jgi:hypothetical protein